MWYAQYSLGPRNIARVPHCGAGARLHPVGVAGLHCRRGGRLPTARGVIYPTLCTFYGESPREVAGWCVNEFTARGAAVARKFARFVAFVRMSAGGALNDHWILAPAFRTYRVHILRLSSGLLSL